MSVHEDCLRASVPRLGKGEHTKHPFWKAADYIVELESKLGKTADGVVVGEGDIIYFTTGNRYVVVDMWRAKFDTPIGKAQVMRVGDGEHKRIALCCSTLKKARAVWDDESSLCDGGED